MQRLEVDDVSDCETCTKRNKDDWELIQEAKCKTLGIAFCQECGRQYAVLVRVEDGEDGDGHWEDNDDDDE